MNYEEHQLLVVPERAPSDGVWEKIEKHLDDKKRDQFHIPAWCYALAILSVNLIISVILSGFLE